MLTIPATPQEIAEGEAALAAARQRMAAFLSSQRKKQKPHRDHTLIPQGAELRFPRRIPLHTHHRGCPLD